MNNFKTNSISAKLYRWYYGTETMPTNLCPYFWSLVFMYITIIPYTLMSLPMILLGIKPYQVDDFWFFRVVMGIISYFILFILFSMGYMFFNAEYHILGMVGWGISALIVSTIAIIAYKDRRELKSDHKPNIVVEFVKAKYNKMCPIITWDKAK